MPGDRPARPFACAGDPADPADLAVRAPQRLLAALERTVPLGDRVVDDVLARWSGRLHELEGLSGALHAAAAEVVTFPDPARQVARLAEVLHVPPSTVTGALLDVVLAAGPTAVAPGSGACPTCRIDVRPGTRPVSAASRRRSRRG